MGDVSRKMTTRTWQRPLRPDSEKRDPEGGVTDRRDRSAADRPKLAPILTNDLWTFTFMLDLDSRASLLESIAAPRPSLEEKNSTFARLRANGMADGDGQDPSSWRKSGRSRARSMAIGKGANAPAAL